MSGSRQTNIHNERVKLTAGMVSNAGLAFIAGGVVTPLVTGQVSLGRVMLSVVWIAAGIYLHWLARDLLGELREP